MRCDAYGSGRGSSSSVASPLPLYQDCCTVPGTYQCAGTGTGTQFVSCCILGTLTPWMAPRVAPALGRLFVVMGTLPESGHLFHRFLTDSGVRFSVFWHALGMPFSTSDFTLIFDGVLMVCWVIVGCFFLMCFYEF